MKLIHQNYGKAAVRILKVLRSGKKHSVKELEAQVMLQGKFQAAYTKGDNRLVVATDSIKNTVNILAKQKLGLVTETFGIVLGTHFLKTYRHVNRVEITLAEHSWDRISVRKRPHNHSFIEKSAATPFAKVSATRGQITIESGIEDLLVMKTTASGFENFLRDEFTTLPETGDRIFATRLKATWQYRHKPKSYPATNAKILESMLAVFAGNYSPSVQATLFEMGEAALKTAREISRISLAMPNQHCLLVNLAPFGLENQNELFVPTNEPHGLIEATVSR
jgi:urate oxidase